MDFKTYFFMHDFFAGSGLVSFALKDYFKCVLANDCDLKKAAIYQANFKDAPLVIEDLRNISGYDLPFAHLSWVSFPCQDLSQAGHQEGILGLRSGLVWEFFRVFDEPLTSACRLEDLIEKNLRFDKDEVIKQIPLPHLRKLNEYQNVITTGFRRTRNSHVQLELRFDGLAGCLRTPKGGSSRQYLIVKEGCDLKARLLSVREVARLMGVPDSFLIPGSASVGFKAMGDAVVVPVAKFIAQKFLLPLAKFAYNVHESDLKP